MATFKSFISEKEVEEAKKKRQEEWEKVRRPDQPLERPQEVYDHRTLYERLKQQRDKKQEEWEDQFKFKNMIYKGLDEEEAGFLTLVAAKEAEQKANIVRKEMEEVSEYREAVAKLHEEEAELSSAPDHTPSTATTATSRSTGETPPLPYSTLGTAGFSKPSGNKPSGVAGHPKTSAKALKSQLTLMAGAIKSSTTTRRKRNSSSGESVETEHAEKKVRLTHERGKGDGGSVEEGGNGDDIGDGIQLHHKDRSLPVTNLSGLVAYSSDSSGSED